LEGQQTTASQQEAALADSEARIRQALDEAKSEWHALCKSLSGSELPADQLSTVKDQLANTQEQFAQAKAEIQRIARTFQSIAQERTPGQTNERLETEVKALREQRDAMREERVLLESELEVVRHRAVRLAEELDDQKRFAEEQQSHWQEEFGRLSGLIEQLTVRLSQMESIGPTARAGAADHGSKVSEGRGDTGSRSRREANRGRSDENAALESVRAQFEILQQEMTRRRRENAESA
jgi:hypothetical protein